MDLTIGVSPFVGGLRGSVTWVGLVKGKKGSRGNVLSRGEKRPSVGVGGSSWNRKPGNSVAGCGCSGLLVIVSARGDIKASSSSEGKPPEMWIGRGGLLENFFSSKLLLILLVDENPGKPLLVEDRPGKLLLRPLLGALFPMLRKPPLDDPNPPGGAPNLGGSNPKLKPPKPGDGGGFANEGSCELDEPKPESGSCNVGCAVLSRLNRGNCFSSSFSCHE